MIDFVKMSASGNDFILIDNRDNKVSPDKFSEFAAKACPRATAVGADGAIFLMPSDKADFRMCFYNSDGSEAEMCGNGARCLTRFAYNVGAADKLMKFESLAGIIGGEVTDLGAKVLMIDPKEYKHIPQLNVDGEDREVWHLDTGVPHVVNYVDNIQDLPIKKLGNIIRFHEEFKPRGANVNFVKIVDKNNIIVRTYERGVEDETLACGTGCTAAALISAHIHGLTSPVSVKTASGNLLRISFENDGADFKNVYLEGDANFIYNATLSEELWK